MPAKNKTSLGLNQWLGNEYPKRIDFVEDNKIIDDELIKRVKYTNVATDTTAGIVTLNTISDKIKLEAPKPDLTPYIPFSKGYRNSSNSDFVLRGNNTDCWAPRHLYMYLENGDYMGCFHVNGGRAYYKVPKRNGGNWCEIMDNHDMTARDNRMNSMDADRNNVRNLAQDAWNKANDAQLNRVVNMRLAGYINAIIRGVDQGNERVGYVVTGVNNFNADSVPDSIHMRCLQFQFGHGGWVTVWG